MGMVKSTLVVLLIGTMFASTIGLNLKVEARASTLEIDAKLKLLNKPAVKSIKSEDGDIIDCVDIYKQPAFDHPALKDHKIQMTPNFFPESQNSSAKDKDSNESGSDQSGIYQIWRRSGSCPDGTAPIRRITKEDLLRAASLENFGKKPPPQLKNSSANFTNGHNLSFPNLDRRPPKFHHLPVTPVPNRSAAYLVTMGYNYIGAQADINVWNPRVDLPNDFTTAQIWLKAGNGGDFESVEAGWVVNPKLYGNTATRLFAYWTRDSYKSTGCFDLTCSGFVQTGKDVALGAAIQPVSTYGGTQYIFNVGIFLDQSGNWWLKVQNSIPVGYWPKAILGSLTHSAILVQWGGEVFSSKVKTSPHTGTAMGSGKPASSQFKNACFMQNVRIKDYSQSLKYPESVSTGTEEEYCYSAYNSVKYGAEPVFYFGGPGRKPPYCP